MNFNARICLGVDLVRSLIRKGQRMMDTTPANKNMRGIVQILRDMDQRLPVCRSLFGLQSRNFEPEICECTTTLLLKIVFIVGASWQEISWDGQSFTVDQISRGSVDVRFKSCPDCQEGHW